MDEIKKTLKRPSELVEELRGKQDIKMSLLIEHVIMVYLCTGWRLHTPNCADWFLKVLSRGLEGMHLVPSTFPKA